MDNGGDSVGGAFYSEQVLVEDSVHDTLTCTFGAAVERAWQIMYE
jgi:hypothetical protein